MVNCVEKVRNYLAESKISANALAQGAGLSAAAVSQYLNGKYTGTVENVETALLGFIDSQCAKIPDVAFVETDAVNKLRSVADFCRTYADIGLVCGSAGTGKTTACEHYAQNAHATVYIAATSGMTAKEFFAELAEKFSVSQNGSIHKFYAEIRDSLKRKNRLLIIDEAERLPFRALDLLRSLHDSADCGIVLVGTERLKANIEGRGKDKGLYEQLYSRVGIYKKTGFSIAADVADIANAAFQNLPKSCITVFCSESKNNLRRLQKLIRRCQKMMAVNSCAITPEVIKAAFESILG